MYQQVIQVWESMHALLWSQGGQVTCAMSTNKTATIFHPDKFDPNKNNYDKNDYDKNAKAAYKGNKNVESLITTTVEDCSQDIERKIKLMEDCGTSAAMSAVTSAATSRVHILILIPFVAFSFFFPFMFFVSSASSDDSMDKAKLIVEMYDLAGIQSIVSASVQKVRKLFSGEIYFCIFLILHTTKTANYYI
jgi:hypothetical protein